MLFYHPFLYTNKIYILFANFDILKSIRDEMYFLQVLYIYIYIYKIVHLTRAVHIDYNTENLAMGFQRVEKPKIYKRDLHNNRITPTSNGFPQISSKIYP